MYMEEYRQATLEFGNTIGKPINLNNLNKNSPTGDFISSSSTTISNSSSINSLNGISSQSNPMIVNQQHYLLMQQQMQPKQTYDEDYNHFYRSNLVHSQYNGVSNIPNQN